jgi:outer membrane immunogenic protein
LLAVLAQSWLWRAEQCASLCAPNRSVLVEPLSDALLPKRHRNRAPDLVQTHDDWAVGGRAGVLVTPRFLTYFDGGYTQARFDGVNYNSNVLGVPLGGTVSLAAQTYNGWFIGSGFEYAFDWLPISGLFLKTEFRYSQYGGNGVSVPLTATAAGGGVPVTGAALNSQKATEFISTELVWRFNWFGR